MASVDVIVVNGDDDVCAADATVEAAAVQYVPLAAAASAKDAAVASDDDACVYLAPLGELWSPESLVRARVVLDADRDREMDAQRKINKLKRKFEEDCEDVLVTRNKGIDREYLRSVQLYEFLMEAGKGIVVTVSAWLDLR